MSELIQSKLPCPLSGCGSSDAYCIYKEDNGELWGHCFSCGGNKPEGGRAAVPAQPVLYQQRQQLTPEQEYAAATTMEDSGRGISFKTAEYLGIRTGLNSQFQPEKKLYPYHGKKGEFVGAKLRVLPKSFYVLGDLSKAAPFGWHQALQARSQVLYVAEGEEDAAAIYEAITDYQAGGKFADMGVAVISGLNAETLPKVAPWINSNTQWKRVVLATDNDEPGRKARNSLGAQLVCPEVYTADFGDCKDASEYLLTQGKRALAQLLLFAKSRWTPANLLIGAELDAEPEQLPKVIVGTGIEPLDVYLKGFFEGMLIGIGAGPGTGKSTVLSQLAASLLINRFTPGCFFLEDSVPEITAKIAGVLTKKVYVGEKIVDFDLYQKAASWVRRNTAMMKNGLDADFDMVMQYLYYLHYTRGYRFFFIDPLTVLLHSMSASEANRELNDNLNGLAKFAQRTGSVVIYSSHLNPARGREIPHEKGGKVLLDQLTGSRAMVRNSHAILGIERNLHAETPAERDLITIRILKNRWGRLLGEFQLQYTSETNELLPIASQIVPPQETKPYVGNPR